MDKDQAVKNMLELLKRMREVDGSDLFITAGFPPAIKIDGKLTPMTKQPLSAEGARALALCVMNERQLKEFESTKECNFAIAPANVGRYRCNAFVQQGCAGLVARTINTDVPDFDKLRLPVVLKSAVMNKNGLFIMVGGTGSGKSTSLAALVDYRNKSSYGHIITLEDPIEYVHPHKNCVIMQREVGVDTADWDIALKNTLRQAPDVILLGEVRDRETMEFAIQFAETGHLAMATLHANNASQALDRIINFFPETRKEQLLMDLSSNLRCICSQRLIKTRTGNGRVAAVEVLLNSPLVKELILKGEVENIPELMKNSNEMGMQTFDQAVFQLYEADEITYEDALRNADSMNEVRLKIRLEGKESQGRDAMAGLDHLSLETGDSDDGGAARPL